jgi:hypothetical protein
MAVHDEASPEDVFPEDDPAWDIMIVFLTYLFNNYLLQQGGQSVKGRILAGVHGRSLLGTGA